MVAVIFAKVPGSRSKHQDKLALRTIMAVEPATPKYFNWSQYPIQFSKEDHWTSIGNANHYPLVLGPTITGMTITKVLINGGAGLNIIFLHTLRKMGLELAGMIPPTSIPFYGIVPGKAAMPLGQITLQSHLELPQTTIPSSSNLRLQTSNHHITPSLGDQH
jgi:hypothetical protein